MPPAPAPPLLSLVAPVVTETVVVPAAVGVPLTGQEMLAPAASVAGGAGVQVPTVTPGGRPDTAQLALTADAVAVALLVHENVPEYAMPIVAVAGKPDRFGVMSDAVVVSVIVAVLLDASPSLAAPVVAVRVLEPAAVGVPETVQVIAAPAATDTGGAGEHAVVRPAGKPANAQVATVAATAGAAEFEHVNVPL